MSGKGATGGHALALGNGVMGSWLASVAVSAGKTLAEKRTGGQPQQPAVPQPTPAPTMQGAPVPMLPAPGLHGNLREVLLTPEPVPIPATAGLAEDFEGRPARSEGGPVRPRLDAERAGRRAPARGAATGSGATWMVGR